MAKKSFSQTTVFSDEDIIDVNEILASTSDPPVSDMTLPVLDQLTAFSLHSFSLPPLPELLEPPHEPRLHPLAHAGPKGGHSTVYQRSFSLPGGSSIHSSLLARHQSLADDILLPSFSLDFLPLDDALDSRFQSASSDQLGHMLFQHADKYTIDKFLATCDEPTNFSTHPQPTHSSSSSSKNTDHHNPDNGPNDDDKMNVDDNWPTTATVLPPLTSVREENEEGDQDNNHIPKASGVTPYEKDIILPWMHQAISSFGLPQNISDDGRHDLPSTVEPGIPSRRYVRSDSVNSKSLSHLSHMDDNNNNKVTNMNDSDTFGAETTQPNHGAVCSCPHGVTQGYIHPLILQAILRRKKTPGPLHLGSNVSTDAEPTMEQRHRIFARKETGNVCANCNVQDTCLWRQMDDNTVLCNACGLYYRTHRKHRPPEIFMRRRGSNAKKPHDRHTLTPTAPKMVVAGNGSA